MFAFCEGRGIPPLVLQKTVFGDRWCLLARTKNHGYVPIARVPNPDVGFPDYRLLYRKGNTWLVKAYGGTESLWKPLLKEEQHRETW